jgi:hypothetical protein
MIGADMLRDPPGFPGCDAGAANGVEQGSLAVVDVSHHGYNRGPRFGNLIGMCLGFEQKRFRVVSLGRLGDVPHVFHDDHCGFLVEHLIYGDHASQFHQRLDDFSRFHCHLLGQLTDANGFGNRDLTDNGLRGHREGVIAGIVGMSCRLGPRAAPAITPA